MKNIQPDICSIKIITVREVIAKSKKEIEKGNLLDNLRIGLAWAVSNDWKLRDIRVLEFFGHYCIGHFIKKGRRQFALEDIVFAVSDGIQFGRQTISNFIGEVVYCTNAL